MPADESDERVCIIAPVGHDAAAIGGMLQARGFRAEICEGPASCVHRIAEGAGALVVTEEALEQAGVDRLFKALKTQPPWSELPLIILTSGGESRVARLLEVAAIAARSVTLLERPMNAATLWRSVEVALRSRRRQYEVRDLLEEQQRKQRALEEAQAALHESERLYRTLVAQIKDYAIFRMDTKGIALSWNEGVKRVLGFEEAEFIGKEVAAAIFTPEDLEAGVPQRDLETAANHGSAGNDRWMQRKDGTRFFASGITTALSDESGKIIGFSRVLRDVTHKKEAEEQLERTVAERTADLRAVNEQLEAFVYSIAHDLRAPLRSMMGYSQILVENHASALGENAQHMLRRINASSDFMDKMLLDLLAYGRAARAELQLGPVPVQRAWESALLQCAGQIEQSRASIETVGPLPEVRAHETTLEARLCSIWPAH